jgi:phage protein D
VTFGIAQYSQPRSIVIVNGKRVPFLSWQVDLNGYNAADTFTVTLPFRLLSHLAGTTDLANTPDHASALLTQADILVQIYVGYPRDPNNYNINDLTQIMYGYMDTVDITFNENGYQAQLQGRNQVAPFTDYKTTNKYPNLTSSAIVKQLAAQHGLSAVVTPTYTLAGTYSASDHTQLTSDITQWDLITYLAEQEGFIVAVKGNTIYFQPRESILKSNPLVFTYGRNLKSLKLSRTPHAGRDLKVYVYSWDPHKKRRIQALAESPTNYVERVPNTATREAYIETYYYPGLTQEQAQRRADAIYKQLSQTEITGELVTYGIPTFDIYQSIQIKGIGAAIDGVTFWPTKVSHMFSSGSTTGGSGSGAYSIDCTFSNLNLPSSTGAM